MSHLFYAPKKTRLHRSELAVPGSSTKMFEKALNSKADYIFLDLEDAVSQALTQGKSSTIAMEGSTEKDQF